MNNDWDVSGSRTADWLLQSIKRNPEGLLLLGAGCALLFRSRRSGGQSHYGGTYRGFADEQQGNVSGRMGGSTREWTQGAARAADTAREYVSSAGKAVSDTAAGYAAAVSEYAQGTGQQVMEQSRRMADHAQSTVQTVLAQQPLAVALAGIAAGAAVAAAFPATRWERRNLGPAGQQLSEAAQAAREKLTETATAAGERLVSAAQKRVLNPEGLKDVAREVAGAVMGEEKSQSPASAGSRTPAQGSTAQPGTSSSTRNETNWSTTNKPGQR